MWTTVDTHACPGLSACYSRYGSSESDTAGEGAQEPETTP